MKKLLLFILMFFFCGASYSQSTVYYTKEGYVIATTKEIVQKAVKYSVDGDTEALRKLLASGQAVLSKKNSEVYIVEWGMSFVKIRPKGQIGEVWTIREAVSKTRQ